MRLLLNIHRNALPPTKILFHVPTTTAAPLTFARLLADIDAVVPLESGTWGLSDYVVEIAGGYECLHFENVVAVLQDGEEVVIRPLRKEEVRARRLGGREQISAGGVVLRDGIGWGRAAWQARRGERPEVEIPAPGGVRGLVIEGEEEEGEAEGGGGVLRIMDRPAIRTQSGSAIHQDAAGDRPRSILRESGGSSSRKRRGSVSFVDELVQGDEDDDEEEDEEDYEPSGEEDEDEEDSDVEMDSEESVDDDTVVKNNVHNGRDKSIMEIPSSVSPPPSEEDTLRLDDTELHGPLDLRTSQDEITEKPQQKKHKRASAAVPLSHFLAIAKIQPKSDATVQKREQRRKQPQNAPFTGTESTKSRNARRKLQRTLLARKKLGLEDQSMTLTELRAKYNDEIPERPPTSDTGAPKRKATSEAAQADAEFQRRRQALLRSLQNGGNDVDQDVTSQAEDVEVNEEEQSRAELSQTEGANDVSEVIHPANSSIDREPTSPERTVDNTFNESDTTPQISQMDGTDDRNDRNGKRKANDLGRSEVEAKQQRSRVLDVASSRRLLFGGLGLRTPKTKEDEERTRNTIAALGKRTPIINGKSKPVEPVKPKITPTSENTDQDAWKKKIVLTAVECWDEDVVLSTPPFPFIQRWDASQQIQRGKKKKKRNSKNASYEEEYDYSQEQSYYDENVEMDYGDETNTNNNEVSQPSTITTHLSQSSNGHNLLNTPPPHTSQNQSLPTPSPDLLDAELIPFLPEDLTTLPKLTLSAVRPGAIIAFKQIHMNSAPGVWGPCETPHRTATVRPGYPRPKGADSLVHVLLAKRDRTPIQFDDDGNRVAGRFSMPGREAEEDAEARGELALSYACFIQARVLREAPLGAEEHEREDTEEEDLGFGEEASECIPEMMQPDVAVEQDDTATAANIDGTNDDIIEDKDDFYDEPELESISTSAQQQSHSQPQPQPESQPSLPSSSQNFLFSSNSSSSSGLSPPPPGLSPTPGNEVVPIIPVVQVEDSQIKLEPLDGSSVVQPIGGGESVDGGSGSIVGSGIGGLNGDGGASGVIGVNGNGQRPIRDMITAVSKGPLSAKRRAKTKRVMRRELRER